MNDEKAKPNNEQKKCLKKLALKDFEIGNESPSYGMILVVPLYKLASLEKAVA